MATPKLNAVHPKDRSSRDALPPSTTRPVAAAHDTLPPLEDMERHDTIPAPTWLEEPNEPSER
jgi:hypothetical protein